MPGSKGIKKGDHVRVLKSVSVEEIRGATGIVRMVREYEPMVPLTVFVPDRGDYALHPDDVRVLKPKG